MPSKRQMGVEAIFDLKQFNAGVGKYLDSLGKAAKSTQGSVASISQLATVFTGAGVAANLITGSLGSIATMFQKVADGAFFAIGWLQQFEIQISTLAAKQEFLSGNTEKFNDALAKGIAYAPILINALRDLSLASPFKVQDVTTAFRLNVAYGANVDTAVELTKAQLDLAAAMGLSADFVERIAYNFGQMNRAGVVTRRDMRDLATAGVDLTQIMQMELGVTMQEFNKGLQDGTMNFEMLTQAFIDFANTTAGGAAERANRTLPALTAKLQDLFTFASIDIGKEAVDKLTVALGSMLDVIQNVIASGDLKIWGAYLSVGFDYAQEAVRRFVTFLGTLGPALDTALRSLETIIPGINDFLDQGFGQIAINAVIWGNNVIAQFAGGMALGISTYIAQVMQWLANSLAVWLAPGSPPKVAPQLPDWGAKAMEEYLKGFTEADFSVLDTVEKYMKDVFDLLLDQAKISGKEIIGLYTSLTQELSKALSSNTDPSAIFAKIGKSLGLYGKEIADLAQKQYNLAKAEQAVLTAEKNLDEARKKETASGIKLSATIEDYNDALLTGASAEVLAQKRKMFNVDKKTYIQSTKDVTAAEAELAAKKDLVEIEKERLSLQKKLVDELIETSKYILQMLKADAAAAAARKAAAGGEDYGKGTIAPTPLVNTAAMAAAKAKQEAELAAARLRMQAFLDKLALSWTTAFQPVTTQVDKIKENAGIIASLLTGENAKAFYDEVGKVVNYAVAELSKLLPPDLAKAYKDALNQELLAWVFPPLLIPIAFQAGADLLTKAWDTDAFGLRTWVTGLLDGMQIWVEGRITNLINLIAGIFTVTPYDVVMFFTNLQTLWTNLQTTASLLWSIFETGVEVGGRLYTLVFVALWTKIGELIDKIVKELNPAFDGLHGWFNMINDIWKLGLRAAFFYFDYLVASLNKALPTLNDWLGKVYDWWVKIADVLANLTVPDWINPGSPTPLEMGLRGIAAQMKNLSRNTLPEFYTSLNGQGAKTYSSSSVANVSNTPMFNLTVMTNNSSNALQHSFAIMRSLA